MSPNSKRFIFEEDNALCVQKNWKAVPSLEDLHRWSINADDMIFVENLEKAFYVWKSSDGTGSYAYSTFKSFLCN